MISNGAASRSSCKFRQIVTVAFSECRFSSYREIIDLSRDLNWSRHTKEACAENVRTPTLLKHAEALTVTPCDVGPVIE